MDGMRFVISAHWPGLRDGSVQVAIAAPCDCQLVAMTVHGINGTDTVKLGSFVDGVEWSEGLMWPRSAVSYEGHIYEYTDFEGDLSDGSQPVRLKKGESVIVYVEGDTTKDVHVGLVFVEG